MGFLISAHCNCGLEEEDIHLGGGMSSSTTYFGFPCYCETCRTLFEGNLLAKRQVCRKCRRKSILPYDDERFWKTKGDIIFSRTIEGGIGREISLTDGKYYCPACGQFELEFSFDGFWD